MTERSRATLRAAAIGLFLFLSVSVFPANVIVPTMELITHAEATGGLTTYGNMELAFEGGYKFGGNVAFGLSHEQQLENFSATPLSLDFLSASMTMRDLFALPLSLSYFVGANDILCSGDGFAQFGVPPIMSTYRGFLYFPTGPLYDGIYQVWGTGLSVQYTPKVEVLSLDLYLYEDTHYLYPGITTPAFTAPGSYSADLRFLLNFAAVKLEAFLGATITPSAAYGLYRGGLLFYASNKNVEFFAQIGVPRWNPEDSGGFTVNLFYLLVEPRLHLGLVSIVPTFFWHPGAYMQVSDPDEVGTFDVNLNIYLGDLAKSTLEGGLEGNFRFQSSSGVFTVKASPWIGFSTPGVTWTVKVNTKLWPFSLTDMFDGFLGVRAEL